MAIRFAVFGLNQGSKIARDAKKNPDYDLVAVAGFGQQAEEDVYKRQDLDYLTLRQEGFFLEV